MSLRVSVSFRWIQLASPAGINHSNCYARILRLHLRDTEDALQQFSAISNA